MERRWVLVLDAAVPLLVATVILIAGVVHAGAGPRPLAVVVGLAAAAVLAARRRAPGWTLAVSGGLVLVLIHLDAAVGPIAVLAPAVALFSLALTRGRRQQLAAGLAAVAMVIAAEVIHAGHASIPHTVGHVALVAIPLLAAETLRTRRSYVSLLLERLALAEQSREHEAARRVEQERMRIARDLHDVLAHTLTSINVQAGVAGYLAADDPSHATRALALIEDASRDAINELRAVLGVLRDRDQPDARAPAPGVDNLAELVARARDAGLDTCLEVTGPRPDRLSEAVSLAAYRIVQESLTNARRHAPGAPVHIHLAYQPRQLAVAVENTSGPAHNDNGNGAAAGVGVTGMAERAHALGGTLRAVPLPTGFRVEATLPYVRGAP